MKKLIFLLILLFFITACTFQKTLTYPESQLTFEEKFEIRMRDCNALATNLQIEDCKNDILIQQAISLDEVSYCNYSSTIKATEICKSLFYLDKAQKNNQPAFCRMIPNEVINNICINSVK